MHTIGISWKDGQVLGEGLYLKSIEQEGKMKDQHEWFYRYSGEAMAALITRYGLSAPQPSPKEIAEEATRFAGFLIDAIKAGEAGKPTPKPLSTGGSGPVALGRFAGLVTDEPGAD